MNRQEYYRKEYKKIKPEWSDSLSIYRDMIDALTFSNTKLLDIGCGHGEFMKSVYEKTAHVYGLEPDEKALNKNTIVNHKIVGRAEDMPFDNDFFDVIVLEWVLEHLSDPQKTFKEIHRVLKPEGHVIFLTPNVWNYNVWIIRAIPNCFHSFFTRRLYDRQENDTYPTTYKINSARKMISVLGKIGFNKKEIILNGDPSYISFNRPLFFIACFIEKLLEKIPSAKVHLIGCFQKIKK